MTGRERGVELIGKIFFGLCALLFFALALTVLGISGYRLAEAVITQRDLLQQTLNSISLAIIGVAVFEVTKFFVEEEIVRKREFRSISEARVSLTKFFTIIIIALSLEGIVVVFETKLERVDHLIYPAALLSVAVFAVIGLGAFRWLTAEDRDERAGGAARPGRRGPAGGRGSDRGGEARASRGGTGRKGGARGRA